MKILHTSDLHLGKKLNRFDLIEEQKLKLSQITTYINQNHIDVLILAGDIYDTALSTDEAITLFNKFLADLIKIEWLNVFIIAGNHDSRTRLGNKEIFRILDSRIHLYTTIKDIEPIEIEGVVFNPIPFLKLEDINNFYDEHYTSLADAFKRVIDELHLDKSKKNICIAHQAVNPKDGEYISSDSEIKQIGGEDTIPSSLFIDFDYVALGHIHMPQKISEHVYYSGSIYKYHHNESSQDRIFKVYNTDNKTIEDVNFDLIHDVKVIEGYYEDLKKDKSDDYVFFKLKDESQILNAADGLKINYPHFIGLEYNYKKNEQETQLNIEVKDKPIDALFEEFYSKMNNKDLTEQQKEILSKLQNGEAL